MANLTEAQKKAVYTRGCSLLVGAAAGSGKTTVLSERVLSLLTDENNPIDGDRFAAMTFTVAAAGELRTRIENKLSEYIKAHPLDKKAEAQLMLVKRAHIGTIHSFCAALIREFAHELDVAPDFTIADDFNLMELSADALDDAVDSLYEDENSGFPELVKLFGKSRDDSKAQEIILSLSAFLDNMTDPDQWINDVREGNLYNGTTLILQYALSRMTLVVRLMRESASLCQGYDELMAKYYPSIAAELECAENLCSIISSGDYAAARAASDIKRARLGTVRDFEAPDVKSKVQGLRDTAFSIIKNVKEVCFVTPAEEIEEDREKDLQVFEWALNARNRYTEEFRLRKDRNKMLSFDDLERYALKLLRDEDIRREIENRYDAFFVDEFQDVNPVQNEIFRLITENRRTLFAVGDVKQSIYGFRKAEPEIFADLAENAEKRDDFMYLTLSQNFRSTKNAIRSVNTVFDSFMTPELGGVDYSKERLEYPDTASEGTAPGLEVRVIADRDPYLQAKEAAGIIAKMIREQSPVDDRGVLRPCRAGDFCIMFRSNTQREEYEKALDEAKIPHSAPAGAGFFESSEIAVTMSLLRIIRNGSLNVDAAAVMLSPLFGFKPDDLLKLRVQDRKHSLIAAASASDDERMQAFAAKIHQLRNASFRMGVADFIEYLYDDVNAELLLTAGRYMTERRRNMRIFLNLAIQRSSAGDDLRKFIRLCDKAAESGKYSPGKMTPSQDSVTMTTIHGSKGLEWPFVILVESESRFNSSDYSAHPVMFDEKAGFGVRARKNKNGLPVFHSSHSYLAVCNAKKQKGISEEMRVLYVALTRAKEKTIVLASANSLKNEADKREKAELYASFNELGVLAGSHLDWILAARMTKAGQEFCAYSVVSEMQEDEETEEKSLPEADSVISNELAERVKYVYPYRSLSKIPVKTAITQFIKKSSGSLIEPDFTRMGRLSGAAIGTATHNYMQFADYINAARDSKAELERLVTEGFIDRKSADAINLKQIDKFFSSELGRKILTSDIRRELEFIFPVDAVLFNSSVPGEKVILQGIADCVIVEDDGIIVVDYKTDRIDDPKRLADLYRRQIDLYRQALTNMLGKRVKAAYLYSFHLGEAVEVAAL